MAGSMGAGEAADAAEPHTDARIVTTNLDESSDLAKVIRPPTDDPSKFPNRLGSQTDPGLKAQGVVR